MKNHLFIITLLITAYAFADIPAVNPPSTRQFVSKHLKGLWVSEDLGIRFNGAGVTLMTHVLDSVYENHYPFDQEQIVDSYGVNSSSLFEGSSTNCRATTRVATLRDNKLVLVETWRTKKSKSGGVLCSFAKDISLFEQPYAYTQTVLNLNADGSLSRQTFAAMSALYLPALTSEDLKNPNLSVENETLKNYLQESVASPGPYPKVHVHQSTYQKR